jgi:hypothetical protein
MQEPITERIGRVVRLLAGRPPARPKSARGAGNGAIVARPAELAGAMAEARSTTFRSQVTGRPGRRARLTARGTLLGLLILCLVTCLLAAWRGLDVLAGLGFCAGCVLAPVYARRAAQLRVTLSVPVVFLLAEVVTQSLTAQGSSGHGSALSVLEGTFLTLADVAPWLFAGTALCIAIAMFRGLPQCIRDLRAGADAYGARRGGAGRPGAGRAGARGEPGLRPDTGSRRQHNQRS